MTKKILVATHGSGHTTKAVEYAVDITLKYDAEIHLVYVARLNAPPSCKTGCGD